MNIYFFGDSICFGQFVSPTYTWVNLLSKELEHYAPEHLMVQNPSVNGRTTRQALEDMNFQIQTNHVDLLYVQFGMNDCNYWASDFGNSRVSKASFQGNLLEIIEKAKKSGVKQIILGTNHPTPKTTNYEGLDISYQQSNEEYNKVIRLVAELADIKLIDHEQHWFGNNYNVNEYLTKLVLPDGVHLSKQGHKVYADFALSQFTLLTPFSSSKKESAHRANEQGT